MSARIHIRTLFVIVACVSLTYSVSAQSTTGTQKKSSSAGSPTVETQTTAPQVVTIVHRINGIKMFRLLRRSQEQVEAIANLDEAFNLMDDVHTNIIAGVALDDGQTIAAWLPEAEVEFGPSLFAPLAPPAPEGPTPKAPRSALAAASNTFPRLPFRGGMLGSPDLTVIGPDGSRLPADYVGLDGATGLSILRLAGGNLNVNKGVIDAIGEGENIRLFNPEPAENSKAITTRFLYVRMGTTLVTVLSIKRAPANGSVTRLKVRSPRLSPANIGGVAVNEAGETVGIVDAVNGPDATVLPTGLIRQAARRVMTHKASVPRPWLGVKGQPVARLNVEQIRNQGWKLDRATSLLDRHLGIMLTSIAPGSPAAHAALKPGDVILKVNNLEVSNDDDFSWMLDQAGPSSEVTFTLARPDRAMEEAVSVELSGLIDPASAFRFTPQPATTLSLLSQGIETIALRPAVATRLGATAGLLVVYVDPASAAFEGGLQPGDIIESINGRPSGSVENSWFPTTKVKEKILFDIVRKKQKLTVTVDPPAKKK